MATLADLIKSRRESGQGVFGSLGKSLREKIKEKIDPRQFINQSGILVALFPQLKTFKAKPVDVKKKLSELTKTPESVPPSVENISMNSEMIAKNTMVLPAIHRDINVMRQNVVKLVKLEGEKPATKADAWFRKAKFRETEYETKITKKVLKEKKPTKKSVTPAVQPKKPKTTFQKIGDTLQSFAGNRAVQVAAGVAVGVGAGTLAESVGAAESGGRYDIAFGDRIKGGKVVNVLGLKTAEDFSGKKLDEMTLSEVQSFQRYRNSVKQNTGAVGKYQFVGSTLFGSKNRPGLVQELGLSMDTVFNKETQDLLNQRLYQKDTAILQKAGITPTPGISYMAHYVGAHGAIAVINAAKRGENISVADAIVNAGYRDPSVQNAELKRIKVTEFESILSERLNKKGFKPDTKTEGRPVPEPTPRNAGDKVNSTSTEVQRGKNAPPTTDVVIQKERLTQYVPVPQSSQTGKNSYDESRYLFERAVG